MISALGATVPVAQDALTSLGLRPDQAKATLFEVLGSGRLYQEAAKHHSCFADPAYERKSPEWKRCYRAGKQPVDAARTFATTWLRQLG